MTLEQALDALHRTGRIRSPWLPGMRGNNGSFYRVVGGRGLRGRFLVAHDDVINRPLGEEIGFGTLGAVSNLDLTDPATVGCLLALLREAEGDPGITTRAPTDPHGGDWYVHVPIEDTWATDSGAPTEGEAIAAALIALAAVRREEG